MGNSFESVRFSKKVWLTNHAIESMSKRNVTLKEVKSLIESGKYTVDDNLHGWIYYNFPERNDNLVCAAVVNDKSIIVKTIMINWQLRVK